MANSSFPILQSPPGKLDPVCGMTVQPERAAGSAEYQGTTYYFCSKGCVAKFEADPEKYLNKRAAPGKDPVCGMTVDPAKAAGMVEHHGETHYFCGKSCLEKFKADPDKCLTPHAPPAVGPGVRYTCPMDAE